MTVRVPENRRNLHYNEGKNIICCIIYAFHSNFTKKTCTHLKFGRFTINTDNSKILIKNYNIILPNILDKVVKIFDVLIMMVNAE